MERAYALLEKANSALRIADHLAYVTYPLLKDTKLVVAILENINNAITLSVEATVEYDRMYKRIMTTPANFQSTFELFKTSSAPRYNIEREHIALISEVKTIMETRKRGTMEFIRGDRLVVCGTDFRTKTVDYEKIKDYVNKTKRYMLKINNILRQNARRF
ncbi:MAG: hypothetical protein ABIH63_01205 [archaeon]